MTKKEKASLNKKKAIYYMVKIGDMSVPDALLRTEDYHDTGKLLDSDYEELSNYLNSLLDEPVEEVQEETEQNDTNEESEE